MGSGVGGVNVNGVGNVGVGVEGTRADIVVNVGKNKRRPNIGRRIFLVLVAVGLLIGFIVGGRIVGGYFRVRARFGTFAAGVGKARR